MSIQVETRIVIILGSAPNAVLGSAWSKPDDLKIVAINNAWRIREDWDFLITPDDFPANRLPENLTDHQSLITSHDYVPANNLFGGIFYAGGTMAFTAGYWALATLKPTVLAFLGCDMVYPKAGKTHFYGEGRPDPLRPDSSLRSLEAKSARLMMHAQRQGCACFRLSSGESRLVFPSAQFDALSDLPLPEAGLPDPLFDQAKAREVRLGYYTPSGKYWESANPVDPKEIDALDQMWLQVAGINGKTGSDRSASPKLA